MDSLVSYVAPALVAVLTAAGAVIGIQFRDVDAYERRRGFWQWLLVLLAAVATMAATNAASGVGNLLQASLLGLFAAAAAVFAHVMWRRRVPDAESRTVAIATAAAACAVLVIAGSVSLTYVGNKGCRQAELLVQYSRASSGAIMPSFDANQGPTVGDFENWSKLIREEADKVTAGDIAQHAHRIGELAGKITDSVKANDKAGHASLGVQYYDELKPILTKCHIKL